MFLHLEITSSSYTAIIILREVLPPEETYLPSAIKCLLTHRRLHTERMCQIPSCQMFSLLRRPISRIKQVSWLAVLHRILPSRSIGYAMVL